MWSCNPWVLGLVGLAFGVLLAGGKEERSPVTRSEEEASAADAPAGSSSTGAPAPNAPAATPTKEDGARPEA